MTEDCRQLHQQIKHLQKEIKFLENSCNKYRELYAETTEIPVGLCLSTSTI